MVIPDEAVEAAARTYADLLSRKGHPDWEELGEHGDSPRQLRLDRMRAALEAAAPHLDADGGVWVHHSLDNRERNEDDL